MVRKPWMGPLVDRAVLVFTSGTSAPVLNALLRGRAMVMAPAGSEQPMLTAACVRAGVAACQPDAVFRNPVDLLRSVWCDSGMRIRAKEIGQRLAAADGAERAAAIVRRVATGGPVVAGVGGGDSWNSPTW